MIPTARRPPHHPPIPAIRPPTQSAQSAHPSNPPILPSSQQSAHPPNPPTLCEELP
ncbi:MAG: hypothetical protein K1X65_17030 [Caldilineales bacterium]|nr:hypothetical protein [Caldilineales bacterium]MCW5860564.1 hypothetical protein [Caldilineales bacterium]